MLRIELNDVGELMQLYQAGMAAKFSEENAELLSSPKLGNALDRLVDQLISEARASHNEPMVEMMQDSRELQTHYPQYLRLQQWLQQQQENNAWSQRPLQAKQACLRVAAQPLTINDAMLAQLLNVDEHPSSTNID